MTTSADTTPITEAALEGELEILRDEVAITERQLADMRAQREAARQAEHEAGEAERAAAATYMPLMVATKQDHGQAGIFAIGDSSWRMSFPQAAQAWGELQACREASQKAAARTDMLHRAVRDIESRKLPGLQTAAFDKQQELAAFRTAQQQAIEHRESRLKASLDDFRRRLKGKA